MSGILSAITPLPGLVGLTDEWCMITYDDDPSSKRAKMPCGCVISREAMIDFCQTVIYKDHDYTFRCPLCKTVWDYAVVFHVAGFTSKRIQELEDMLTQNCLETGEDNLRKCPGCKAFCERKDKNNAAVRCYFCTKQNGNPFEFCWDCSQKWRHSSYRNGCGNADCLGMKPLVAQLQESNKTIVGVKNCPSIRACPQCGATIEHIAACKHMACKGNNCKAEFCFICLKLKINDQWQCGAHNTPCVPAPLQTEKDIKVTRH